MAPNKLPSGPPGKVIDMTAEDDQENRMIHPSANGTLKTTILHRYVPTAVRQKREAPPSHKTHPKRHRSSSQALSASSHNQSTPQSPDQSSAQSVDQIADHSASQHSQQPNLPNTSVSVVIPRPSPDLQREIDAIERASSLPFGVPQNFYQVFTTDYCEKMAEYRKYPAAKPRIPASEIDLDMGDNTFHISKIGTVDIASRIRKTLEFKLGCIKGPRVSYDVPDPKILPYLAANFDFINEYKLHKEIKTTPREFLCGCNCGQFCSSKCECLHKDEDTNETIIPYDRQGLLTPDFLKRKAMISECNPHCECSSSEAKCWNHVVQKGRTIPLVIFHTGTRGFGLRSPAAIRRGQFIDRYLGEVITKEKAAIREEVSLKDQSYFFSLDWSGACKYVVDAQKFGSVTRFMNHSCNPNCKLIPVSTVQGDNPDLYDLAFFALRDIPPNTELTFDYNPEAKKVKEIDPNAVQCLCGEKNCRKQLWPNKRKGTK